jgi:very-short-patch-repair endonuclease
MRVADQLKPAVLCSRLAARQHGCISLAQAIALGMSEAAVLRLASSGAWIRLLPGVYSIVGSEPSWRRRLMASVLWLGEGAAVSHGSAAALWGMPGFPSGTIELSTTANRQSRFGVTVHKTKKLAPHEVGLRGQLPVTSPTRTLIDLSADPDAEAFEVAFHYCLYRRTVSLGRMRMICAERGGPGAIGAPLLREMLDLYSDDERPPESPLEVRVRRLLAREKLPPPVRQHPVIAASRNYRIDLAYPQIKVAIEVDGYRWHSNRLSWDKDRTKLAALQGEGWHVVHATHDLATRNTDLLLAAIRRALGASLPLDGP